MTTAATVGRLTANGQAVEAGAPGDAGARRLQIGDRVRVRHGVGVTINCTEMPHYPDEQGQTGMLMGERAQASGPNHPWLVLFDQPYPLIELGLSRIALVTRHYAA